MTDEQKYDLIERYLDQQLSASERSDFEQKLENDPALREELELHQQLAETLGGTEVHQFRAELKAINQKWQAPATEKKVRSIAFRRIAAIAATVLILLLAYQFLKTPATHAPEALFASNFEPYNMVMNQRASLPTLVAEAASAYEAAAYENAAKAFRQLEAENQGEVVFQFYLAISELALDNSAQAIPLLKEIIRQDHPLFAEQSRWYLALAYLHNGDIELTKSQLQKIQPEEFQYPAAQKILDQLQ